MTSHDLEITELHGHRLAYRSAGDGPVVLLVHGMAGTNAVWEEVMPALTGEYTVIAPDLPGHGQSGASAGDYSVGAMAATLRDLLLSLGHERATIVGLGQRQHGLVVHAVLLSLFAQAPDVSGVARTERGLNAGPLAEQGLKAA